MTPPSPGPSTPRATPRATPVLPVGNLHAGTRVKVWLDSLSCHGLGHVRKTVMIHSKRYVGIELDLAQGRNDGTGPDGERHFHCAANHGLFVRADHAQGRGGLRPKVEFVSDDEARALEAEARLRIDEEERARARERDEQVGWQLAQDMLAVELAMEDARQMEEAREQRRLEAEADRRAKAEPMRREEARIQAWINKGGLQGSNFLKLYDKEEYKYIDVARWSKDQSDALRQRIRELEEQAERAQGGNRESIARINDELQAKREALQRCPEDAQIFLRSDHRELALDFERLVDGYMRLHGIDIEARNTFVAEFNQQVFEGEILAAHVTAVKMWTSPLRLMWQANPSGIELCSILNEIVYEDPDDPNLIRPCVRMTRLLNAYCVTSAGFEMHRNWPANNRTFRGGGLPLRHRSFFAPGVQYRAPAFVATSFDRSTAKGFASQVSGDEQVLWTFHFDPQWQCLHVNFIDVGLANEEREFLFAPFSAFTVLSAGPGDDGVYQIELQVAHDNLSVPMNLPVAPWR